MFTFAAVAFQLNRQPFFLCHRLKADKELVKEVYSAAKRFKMERVKKARLFSHHTGVPG